MSNSAEWRRDTLPFDKRPSRQFVWLSGEKFHSGVRWRRDWWGVAFIRPDDAEDGRQGYRRADIERLEEEGDMDPGSAEIFGWLPACTPAYFDMNINDAIAVNVTRTDHDLK